MADYKTCDNHFWPRTSPGGSIRSIGDVFYLVCNNCLSMKITFSTHVLVGDEWVKKSSEKIVEPSFD